MKNGIESQDNPLRTRKEFYQPVIKVKHRSTRKNFPEISGRHQSFSTIQEPRISIKNRQTLQYIDGLQKANYIHRSFHRQQFFYPQNKKDLSPCPEQYHNKSFKPSKSRLVKQNKLKNLDKQRNNFLKTFNEKRASKQQLHCTFYNTGNKSRMYSNKFREDECITERSSPLYQNMLNRTFIEQYIADGIKKSQRKFIHGY